MKTAVFGSLAYDIFLKTGANVLEELDGSAQDLSIIPLASVEKRFGGNGGNIVSSMALLGQRPILYSALGNDGEAYMQRLRTMDLPVSGIQLCDDVPSTTIFFLVDACRKEIAMYIRGASERRAFHAESIPTDIECFHVGPSLPSLAKDALSYAFSRNAVSIFDPGQDVYCFTADDLDQCMRQSTYTIMNLQESKFALSRIAADTAKKTFRITTCGKEGVCLEHELYREVIPACPLHLAPTQTVGAGDAFRAGLLTGFAQGHTVQESVRLGSGVASLALLSGQAQMDVLELEVLQSLLQATYQEQAPDVRKLAS